jgi:hypothetical protein
MSRPEATLRGLLAEAGDLYASMLHGANRSLPLDVAARCTGFQSRAELRDRSVLIATAEQLTAALILIELDGVARRIILCPPGLSEEHLTGTLRQAELDTIICDEDRLARCSRKHSHPLPSRMLMPRPKPASRST